MEVHHHPDLHHKPKPWKEYFLEFIMIFLAVTLGFFAESFREYRSDRAKEKEYIEGFIKDLSKDVEELNTVISQNYDLAQGIYGLEGDFSLYLNRGKRDSNLIKKTVDSFNRVGVLDRIYDGCTKYLTTSYRFKTHDATMVQLRNSGGFRLIQKDHAADSIATYDLVNLNTEYEEKIYVDEFAVIYDLWAHTFDLSYVAGKKDPITESALISGNNDMRYFYNKVAQLRGTVAQYVNKFLMPQLEYAKRMIEYLKKEYKVS